MTARYCDIYPLPEDDPRCQEQLAVDYATPVVAGPVKKRDALATPGPI
jgi:hypothetical protein